MYQPEQRLPHPRATISPHSVPRERAMQSASIHLDPTDIPTVPAHALKAVMDLIVERGQALVLFHGACPATRRSIEDAFWQSHTGDRAAGNATIIRFWHLVDAMSARRLKTMFLDRGYVALAPLAAAAASARLNIHWGFKPQHLVHALTSSDAKPTAITQQRRLAA